MLASLLLRGKAQLLSETEALEIVAAKTRPKMKCLEAHAAVIGLFLEALTQSSCLGLDVPSLREGLQGFGCDEEAASLHAHAYKRLCTTTLCLLGRQQRRTPRGTELLNLQRLAVRLLQDRPKLVRPRRGLQDSDSDSLSCSADEPGESEPELSGVGPGHAASSSSSSVPPIVPAAAAPATAELGRVTHAAADLDQAQTVSDLAARASAQIEKLAGPANVKLQANEKLPGKVADLLLLVHQEANALDGGMVEIADSDHEMASPDVMALAKRPGEASEQRESEPKRLRQMELERGRLAAPPFDEEVSLSQETLKFPSVAEQLADHAQLERELFELPETQLLKQEPERKEMAAAVAAEPEGPVDKPAEGAGKEPQISVPLDAKHESEGKKRAAPAEPKEKPEKLKDYVTSWIESKRVWAVWETGGKRRQVMQACKKELEKQDLENVAAACCARLKEGEDVEAVKKWKDVELNRLAALRPK